MNDHRVGGYGLHVSLQVKAFGKFIDTVEGEEEIESLYYQVAGCVSQKMSGHFASESKRKDAFLTEVEKLFPRIVHFKEVIEGCAKSDCTVEVAVGSDTFRVGNKEFKNEFVGITSDPYNQNIAYFVHLQAPYKGQRAPMLLVSLVGCHYFQVFGAVWNGGEICVDPLCSPASFLFVPRDPLCGIAKLARIFSALKETILELGTYYANTPLSLRQIDHKGPYFQKCSAGTLEYGKKMGAVWLYEAKLHNPGGVSEVVVKFVRFRYGEDAHKCLAEQQLAPTLYSCELLNGRWYAIVMEKVVGKRIQTPVDPQVQASLSNAIAVLHSNGYVHGDLRPQNILVVGDTVRILDFDWAGMEGTARYPKELNMENEWHHDVRCDGVITKEHDEYEVRRIFSE